MEDFANENFRSFVTMYISGFCQVKVYFKVCFEMRKIR